MSYLEPLRVELRGDKVEAMRYINTARRLAHGILKMIREAGVGSARRTFRLGDEVIIDVVVAGSIVSARITVGSDEQSLFLPEDFVITPIDADYPFGVDFDYPQLVARPPKANGGPWATYFKSAAIPAYRDFNGPKGTYGALFPNGLRHAGNIDWVGQRGERVSWYGPERRYWAAQYQLMNTQYGPYVFVLGKKLMDLRAYPGIDEHYVMGACIIDRWLYVVQANLPQAPEEPTPLPQSGRLYDAYITPPYPKQSFKTRLMRYLITNNPTENPPDAWGIALGAHESLWEMDGEGWLNPWFFSPDGTKVVSTQLPTDSMVRAYVTHEQAPFGPGSPGSLNAIYEFSPVCESSDIIELRIGQQVEEERTTHQLNAVDSEGHEAIIACDYNADNERVDLYLGYEPFRTPIGADAWELPVTYTSPASFVFDYDDSLVLMTNRTNMAPHAPPAYGNMVPDFAEYYFRVGEFKLPFRKHAFSGEFRILHAVDLRFGAFVCDKVRRTDVPEDTLPQDMAEHYRGMWASGTEYWHGYALQQFKEEEPASRPFTTAPWINYVQYFARRSGGSTVAPLLMISNTTMVTGVASNTTMISGVGTVFADIYDRIHRPSHLRPTGVFADEAQFFGQIIRYNYDGSFWTSGDMIGISFEGVLPWQIVPDFDGYIFSQSLAATPSAMIYAGATFKYAANSLGNGRELAAGEFATRGELPTITGVEGEERRYHPVWVLGKVPRRLS